MLPPDHRSRWRAVALALGAAACGSATDPGHPGAIIVAPASDTLAPGTERQFTARVVNEAGDTVAAEGALWSSSAPDVAWVGPDGKVTATAFGSATITALVSDERGGAQVMVQRSFSARTVVVGPRNVCALDLSGQAWCFGDNEQGQLGVGNAGIPRRTLTSPVAGGHTFTAIGVGATGSCGLDQAGKAWCWGGADWLGQGRDPDSFQSVSVPVLADTLRSYDALAVAGIACGLTGDLMYCWGRYSRVRKIFDTPIPGFTSIQLEYAYAPSGCGVTAAGEGSCWIEDGDFFFYSWSSDFSGRGAIAQIAVGSGFRCARYASGQAACLGTNDAGQLGNGTTADAATPTPLPGVWQQLSAGNKSACGLAADGTALCWGANESGQLGTGDSTATLVPVAVAGTGKFRQISTGGGDIHRTCAITTSDLLFCWGAGLSARPAVLGY